MGHLRSLRLTFIFSALLCLLPVAAHAKFIIEFSDGHRMTVSNYEEQGEMLKVYTSLGSFSFHKADVIQITKADERNPTKPAETRKHSVHIPEKEYGEILPESGDIPPQPQEQPRSSSPIQDFASQIEDGLFRMRYIFALAIGIKALKVFLAASVR